MWDLSYWWSTVSELFEPTDGQIKELKREYESYKQKENQNSTDYAEEMEIKANELRTLGLYYTSKQIGNQINENLLPGPKLFVFTNLMAQKIPCDLQSILKVLKTYDDTIMGKKATLVTANIAETHGGHPKKNTGNESLNKRRNKKPAKALASALSSDNEDEASVGENGDKYMDRKTVLMKLRKYRKLIRKFKFTDNNDEENGDADEEIESKAGNGSEHNMSYASPEREHNMSYAASGRKHNMNYVSPGREHNKSYVSPPQAAKRTRSRSPSRFGDKNNYKKARMRSPESRGRTVEYSRNIRNKSRSRSPPDRGNSRSTYRNNTYGPKTSHYSSDNYTNNRNRGGNPSQNEKHNDSRAPRRRNIDSLTSNNDNIILNNHYFLVIHDLQQRQESIYIGLWTEKHVSDIVDALDKLCTWLTGNLNRDFEGHTLHEDDALVTNAIYDLTYDHFQGRQEPSVVQCYMMSSNDWTGIDNTEVTTKEGEDKIRESTEDTSSKVNMLGQETRLGPLRTFGVSTRCAYVPSERINLLYGVSNEQLCENMAFSQTLKADSNEIPDSDAAEVLHQCYTQVTKPRGTKRLKICQKFFLKISVLHPLKL